MKKGSSKIYPIYDKHKKIIKEMLLTGISRLQTHRKLNLPDSLASFIMWCKLNNIKYTKTSTSTYNKKKPIIIHMLKTNSFIKTYKQLNLPGTHKNFIHWCRKNNIKPKRSQCSFVNEYEKEIAKLLITNSTNITCNIINKKYSISINRMMLCSYLHTRNLSIQTLINKHFPTVNRPISIHDTITLPWDKILEDMKTTLIVNVAKKYYVTKGVLDRLAEKEFNCFITKAFYNKFGYKYHRYGYMEQHTEFIYNLLKEGSLICNVAARLKFAPVKLKSYIQHRHKGKKNLIKYFNANPDKLQEIMNRYTKVEDDMLDFSEDEYLRQSSKIDILDL